LKRTKLAAALAITGAAVFAAPAGAATFTVKNTNDAGNESLRWAITAANNAPGDDDIAFDIPGAGPQVIQPASALPWLTEEVRIDGATQPGYAGQPLIEIDAVDVPNGLVLATSNSLVRGLAIHSAGLTLGAGAPNGNGIRIQGNGNTLLRNHLGTDAAGMAPFGNNNAGVRVVGSANQLGLPYHGNVIADNLNDGIEVISGAANVIQSNRIGLNTAGGALGNLNHGVDVYAGGTRIGGAGAAANGISGNLQAGVRIMAGTGSVVTGNRIGLNQAGAPRPNDVGIELRSAAATVEANTIANNSAQGVRIQGNQHTLVANTVSGSQSGIVVRGDDNAIGAGNVVTANAFDGVRIENGALGNRVEDSTLEGNGRHGVALLNARRALVAGAEIHSNGANGVHIDDSDPVGPFVTSSDHRVERSRITENGTSGVWIAASIGNTISDGNTLSSNGEDGVTVASGSSSTILGNTIKTNGDLAIDLAANGVTLNDALDADTGANQLQNHPVLSAVSAAGNAAYTLDAAPLRTYRLELYSSDGCNGGSAARTVDVTTDALGHAQGTFTGLKTTPAPRYFSITATAMSTVGLALRPADTSELSPCVS
jgi:parallel beta-helix repeat protein